MFRIVVKGMHSSTRVPMVMRVCVCQQCDCVARNSILLINSAYNFQPCTRMYNNMYCTPIPTFTLSNHEDFSFQTPTARLVAKVPACILYYVC